MGNGENMINVGVSLKLGKSSPYAGMSRAQLVHKVARQEDTIKALSAQMDEMRSMILALQNK